MLSCFAFKKTTRLSQTAPCNIQRVWAKKYFLILCNKCAPKVTKVSYVMGKEQALSLIWKQGIC